VVKYIKERNALAITETSVSADSLRLTPTDGLDNAIYDVAVTIRRQLPSTWTTARVMQGTTVVSSSIVTVNNVKYIQFDVVPDKGVYTIANAATSKVEEQRQLVQNQGRVLITQECTKIHLKMF
jgi:hypothetical protein